MLALSRSCGSGGGRVARTRPLLAACSLALLLSACGEGEAPVFVDVSFPAWVPREQESIEVLALLRDDRGVSGAEVVVYDPAVLLDPDAVDQPAGGEVSDEQAHRRRIPMESEGGAQWRATLAVPGVGDLLFTLEAWDGDELRSESPGERSPEVVQESGGVGPLRRLYLLPVLDLDQGCGPGLPACPEGQECQDGECVPEDPCRSVICPDGRECDPSSGVCRFIAGSLCAPCIGKQDCTGAASYCVLYAEGGGCGRDCRSASCPDGYLCQAFGSSIRQCVRSTGSCDE